MNTTAAVTNPFPMSTIRENIDDTPLRPLGFSKVEWLKIPCQLALYGIIKLYELSVKIFTYSLFFLSQQTKQPLYKHIRNIDLLAEYYGRQMILIVNCWKYQGYLVQTTQNIGRLDVLKQERDLEVAKEFLDEERSEFKKQYKIMAQKEFEKPGLSLDELEKKYPDDVEAIRKLIKGSAKRVAAQIFPDATALKQRLGGVCAAAVISSASERLLNDTTWDDIANNMHEGVDETIAGAQAFFSCGLKHNLHVLAKMFQVQLVEVSEINENNDDNENFEEISNLDEGLYFLSLHTKNSQHAILYCREENNVIIIDPNVGLFCANPDEAQALITKIVGAYPLQNNSKSHGIYANEIIPLEQTDDFWDNLLTKALSKKQEEDRIV